MIVRKWLPQPESFQEPDSDHQHDNYIQDPFDGVLHWNEAIHQPKKKTHDYDDSYKLKKRHSRSPVECGLFP